jgi:predicted DCC family thiol-disulfide oxidoreductase YuxK
VTEIQHDINTTERHILLFDGVCNLCNGLVRFIMKRAKNKRFKFIPLQSPQGLSMLKNYGLPVDDLDTVVFISGEKYYLRSSAILHVLKELGGIWKLFYIFIIIPRFLRDFIYNIIAKTRYKIFGRQDTCTW